MLVRFYIVLRDIVLTYYLQSKKTINFKTVSRSVCRANNHQSVFAQLNINLIWNKFKLLVQQIKGTVDVMISETKIDDSFLLGNFLMETFSSSCTLDRDSHILLIREDTSSDLLEVDKKLVESLFVKLNFRNDKMVEKLLI